jgi:hypothetical protein
MKIQFEAEIRSVNSKKLITNDIEYKVTFNSSDPHVLDLGKIGAERVVKVSVEYE